MSTDELTPAQMAVYAQLVEGKSNAEIATELRVVEKTVKAHVSGILRKLELDSRARLIARHYKKIIATGVC